MGCYCFVETRENRTCRCIQTWKRCRGCQAQADLECLGTLSRSGPPISLTAAPPGGFFKQALQRVQIRNHQFQQACEISVPSIRDYSADLADSYLVIPQRELILLVSSQESILAVLGSNADRVYIWDSLFSTLTKSLAKAVVNVYNSMM